jgi:hypothetical protein
VLYYLLKTGTVEAEEIMRKNVMIAVFTALVLSQADHAAPGPLASWSFDSSLATTYYDVSGHGYNAVSTGSGLALAAGLRGKALDCSGDSFDIPISNSRNDFVLRTFSIEALINPGVDVFTQGQGKIFDFTYAQSGVRNGYTFCLDGTGKPTFFWPNLDASSWLVMSGKTALSAGKWYHVAVSYDSTAIIVYVNGLRAVGTSLSYPIKPSGQDARIASGRTAGSTKANSQFTGKIDEMKFYNYALPPDSIFAHSSHFLPIPVCIPYTPDPSYDRRPLLTWQSFLAITGFRVQIATSNDFSSPIVNVTQSATSFRPDSNLPFGKIFWRIGNGADSSLWSATSSISIKDSVVPRLVSVPDDQKNNRRPVLRWYRDSRIPVFRIQLSISGGFGTTLVNATQSDTLYQPLSDLALGIYFWRVGNNADSTNWSLVSSFTVQDSSTISVPTQYATITEAVLHGSNILVTASRIENIAIANKCVTITGINDSISITGQATITNSIVTFKSIRLLGTAGTGGSSVLCSWPNCSSCPSTINGTTGGNAITAYNSSIWILNSFIQGGKGGSNGFCKTCDEHGSCFNYPGSSGSGGTGISAQGCTLSIAQSQLADASASSGASISASQKTIIDTQNTILGKVNLDSTSRFLSGSTAIHRFPLFAALAAKIPAEISAAGRIRIYRGATAAIAVYSLTGKLVYTKSATGPAMISPGLAKGIYVISLKVDKQKMLRKCLVLGQK